MPAALLTFVVVAAAHLFLQAVAPGGLLAGLTQVLLMPALAWVVVKGTPDPKSRLVQLVLLAIGLSWLGDTLPRFVDGESDLGFSLMLGAFFLAQLAYVAAFLPFVGRSILRTRPALVAPYLCALVLVLWVSSGAPQTFLTGVGIYGITIIAMAVLASGLDRVAATGAILFLVSDALIAVRALGGLEMPLHGLWVMLTYLAAQSLIVLAVAHHERATVVHDEPAEAVLQA